MTNRLIQNITASTTPQKQDLFSDGMSADELLQEAKNLPTEYIETTEELTKDNSIYDNITFSVKLDAKLRNEVVTFYVVDEDGKYRVRVFNAIQKMLDTGSNDPPHLPVSFSQQMVGNNLSQKLREISGAISIYSQKKREARQIIKWLIELQKKLKSFQQQLSYVVINDKTDLEIPWEMLELPEEKKENQKTYLGASFITVRWQDIDNPECWDENNNLLNLEFEPEDCLGNILAYTNTKDFKSVKEEIATLQQFNATCHENPYNFLNELEKVRFKISLVYIASHGFFNEDIYQTSIGEDDTKKRISFIEINKYNFNCFKASPSIVFMNACHSGRLGKDHMKTPNYRTGFTIFFLEKGAKGVIGTLGKVIDQYAVKVSNNFFAECQRNPELSVAAILRNIRKAAAEIYRERKDDETERLFLATFMYIYYGNPMTVLRLP